MDRDQLKRERIAAVRTASKTLGELLEEDKRARDVVVQSQNPVDRSSYLEIMRAAWSLDGMSGLRREKRLQLLAIAARDVNAELSLEEVGGALAHLADACFSIVLEAVGALDLAVIGMGKLGAQELNYVSDVDVMFVSNGDLEVAGKAAEFLLESLGSCAPEGRAFMIDTNLRPEGRSGVLVRSVDAYLEYYKRWAKPWEHQALIRARAIAGDSDAGQALIERTRELVFPVEVSPERVASIRKIKERIEDHAARAGRRRNVEGDDVKLGPGGIRDIEFSAQLLQLVHGGSDPSVRLSSTLDALSALADGGYMAEEDAAGLSVAYRWLRTVEHRLQLRHERRVHRLPADEAERARVAHVMGFKDSPVAGAAARFDEAHKSVLADVRSRFEKLFYRPMIESLADSAVQRLSQEALQERLRVLGFRDVQRAARTLDKLVTGTSRRARLLRVLTPAFLRFLAPTPFPDQGLFAFLRLGERLGDRLDALAGLRDNPPALRLLALVLGSGRLLGELLEHVPEELQAIVDPRHSFEVKDRERLLREAAASLEWREPHDKLNGLRRFKRREMFHVAVADVAGGIEAESVGAGLSNLAEACLEAALSESDCDFPFAVIGMGKLGGRELNYASDLDVMFVHQAPDQRAPERAAEQLLKAIGEMTAEGQAFQIDAKLRPEGTSGALARAFDAYGEYYGRWAKPWEYLALIKARPVAGDRELGAELVARTRAFAYPRRIEPAALGEIRHVKARMERERVPRGVDPRRHLKLGPGGLADVEFAVQLLQLKRGHDVVELQVSNTLEALAAANRVGLISEDTERRLTDAYRLLMRLRNHLYFMGGRRVDVLPAKPEELEALGIALGFRKQPRQELEEAFLRTTRRARKAAEPLIYG